MLVLVGHNSSKLLSVSSVLGYCTFGLTVRFQDCILLNSIKKGGMESSSVMCNSALTDCVASSIFLFFFCYRKQLACGKWTCDVKLEKPELLHTAPLRFCAVSHFKSVSCVTC